MRHIVDAFIENPAATRTEALDICYTRSGMTESVDGSRVCRVPSISWDTGCCTHPDGLQGS